METGAVVRTRSVQLSKMVRQVYAGTRTGAEKVTGLVGTLAPIVRYPWHRLACRRASAWLVDGVKAAGQRLASLPSQIKESEMVSYWKDLVRGLPDYAALVRARKFQEIENVLLTLARQNEILRIHENRIGEIQKAVRELESEADLK